jgi:uncharacterized protein (DUF1810 family)
MSDPWRLERFVAAQDRGGTYQQAVAELRAGAKVSHWMWFVFPQIAGLGMSATSREYAISSVAEARAYLAHPLLGPRLRECAQLVADTEGRSAERIFGPVDAVKLCSSVTLFAAAADEAAVPGGAGGSVFRVVLAKYFGGVPDAATVSRLLRTVPRSPGREVRAPRSERRPARPGAYRARLRPAVSPRRRSARGRSPSRGRPSHSWAWTG